LKAYFVTQNPKKVQNPPFSPRKDGVPPVFFEGAKLGGQKFPKKDAGISQKRNYFHGENFDERFVSLFVSKKGPKVVPGVTFCGNEYKGFLSLFGGVL
jgi:hypothetical protein